MTLFLPDLDTGTQGYYYRPVFSGSDCLLTGGYRVQSAHISESM